MTSSFQTDLMMKEAVALLIQKFIQFAFHVQKNKFHGKKLSLFKSEHLLYVNKFLYFFNHSYFLFCLYLRKIEFLCLNLRLTYIIFVMLRLMT